MEDVRASDAESGSDVSNCCIAKPVRHDHLIEFEATLRGHVQAEFVVTRPTGKEMESSAGRTVVGAIQWPQIAMERHGVLASKATEIDAF